MYLKVIQCSFFPCQLINKVKMSTPPLSFNKRLACSSVSPFTLAVLEISAIYLDSFYCKI